MWLFENKKGYCPELNSSVCIDVHFQGVMYSSTDKYKMRLIKVMTINDD